MSFMYMTFFWGIAVANHYFKVFGHSSYREPIDDSLDPIDDYLDDIDHSFSRSFRRQTEKPKWRDKDLV